MFDPKQVRSQFPIFQQHPDLVYLDNAATSQKPQVMINAVARYYQTDNANVGRGVHNLAESSTEILQQSRQIIAQFFKAQPEELILTQNTTEAINGMAYGWADQHLKKDDVILASLLEHHSNLVVWQEVMKRTGAKLMLVNVTPSGQLDWQDFSKKLKKFKPKLVALTHVSNVTGAYVDLKRLSALVRHHTKAKILIDGAQAVPHLPINFNKLDIDFYAFSGHKMLGPMGVGGLLVKSKLLKTQEMRPWFFGGGMIEHVLQLESTYQPNPQERFQAGTPDVAGAVGLAAACDYLTKLGMDKVLEHDQHLVKYAVLRLAKLKHLIELIGPVESVPNIDELVRVGSVAFIPRFAAAHEVALVLSQENVALRSGYHCAEPLHTHFNWPATLRMSFNVYNSKDDIDQLVQALKLASDKFL
jgi:cysteine desulfurase/selenocysteine lyase